MFVLLVLRTLEESENVSGNGGGVQVGVFPFKALGFGTDLFRAGFFFDKNKGTNPAPGYFWFSAHWFGNEGRAVQVFNSPRSIS